MANDEHVAILKKGVEAWNAWRDKNPDIRPDLREADLSDAELAEADLSRADLSDAHLSEAILINANLSAAKLHRADLSDADLIDANLSGLRGANLSAAKLHRADLQGAILTGSDLSGADLTGCRIHGVSAWRLKLDGAKQQNLVITRRNEPTITVDDIEVAQFIYLMLDNQKIRNVIDTITSKAVLILGRFTE